VAELPKRRCRLELENARLFPGRMVRTGREEGTHSYGGTGVENSVAVLKILHVEGLGVLVHACSPSYREVEVGGLRS
jgi:hypothetical protein